MGRHYPNKLKNAKVKKLNNVYSEHSQDETNVPNFSSPEANIHIFDTRDDSTSEGDKRLDTLKTAQSESIRCQSNFSKTDLRDTLDESEKQQVAFIETPILLDSTENELILANEENRILADGSETNNTTENSVKYTHPLIKYVWVIPAIGAIGTPLIILGSGGSIEDFAKYITIVLIAVMFFQILGIIFTLRKPEKYKKQSAIISGFLIFLSLLIIVIFLNSGYF